MNNINNNTNTKSDYNIKINATIEILKNIKMILGNNKNINNNNANNKNIN